MERAEVAQIVREELAKSDLARMLRKLQSSRQLFTVSFSAVAAGTVTLPFTLPKPWQHTHDAVFAGLFNAPAGSWGPVAAGATSLTGGNIYMSGNPAVQTLQFYVVSYGS